MSDPELDHWSSWYRVSANRPKILIIQRDNIGDLVLCTPFMRALRDAFPAAQIDVLANSYNAPVLSHNRAINHVFAYTKLKHRAKHQTVLSVLLQTWALRRMLRRVGYDLAILMSARPSEHAWRLARACRPARLAAFVDRQRAAQLGITLYIDPQGTPRTPPALHRLLLEQLVPAAQRERLPALLPPCEVQVNASLKATLIEQLDLLSARGPVIGFHISARKRDQRWSAQCFAQLMRLVCEHYDARVLLLWAPGGEDETTHPGDDEKAAEIRALTADLPVVAHATHRLEELIAALAVPQALVMSDGGAMHLAAAAQRPMVALFGNSDPAVWHAWRVPQRVLRDESQIVAALSVERVFEALGSLLAELAAAPTVSSPGA